MVGLRRVRLMDIYERCLVHNPYKFVNKHDARLD
jgi:hypothetical protein